MKPLCVDLYCGLGGWTEGFLAEGYRVIGFDNERHDYGQGGYPGQLVLQDVLTIHGSQFRDASVIVASPPCQSYSYMAMPWSRGKAMAAWHRESPERIKDLNALFDACFRIQLEASKAAGRYIPMVVENVKGAQPWVGRAKAHYGSFYLWGDIAMHGDKLVIGSQWMRAPRRMRKVPGFNFHQFEETGMPGGSFQTASVAGLKLPGNNSPILWKDREIQRLKDAPVTGIKVGGTSEGVSFTRKEGVQSVGFNVAAARNWRAQQESGVKCTGQKNGEEYAMTRGAVATKTVGHVNIRDGFNHTRHLTNQRESDGVKQGGEWWHDSTPGHIRSFSSKSDSRKAASAEIAKIPFPLSEFVARSYRP